MKAVLDWIAREPAMVVALVLALVNTIWNINADQAVQIQTIVEAVIVLVAGKVVREQVTPVSKLPPSMRG